MRVNPWSGNVLSLLILAGCLCPGCGSLAPKETSLSPEAGGAESVRPSREFLADGYDEDAGGELYAYLLVAEDRPGSEEQERLEALVEAFWKGLVAEGTASSRGTSYLPLSGMETGAAEIAAGRGLWPLLAEQYHHDRARLILDRIGGLPGVGPHWVAAFQPLGQVVSAFQPLRSSLLVVDFSVIPREKFLPLFHILQDRVMENSQIKPGFWDLAGLKNVVRPLLGRETDNAVWETPPPAPSP